MQKYIGCRIIVNVVLDRNNCKADSVDKAIVNDENSFHYKWISYSYEHLYP